MFPDVVPFISRTGDPDQVYMGLVAISDWTDWDFFFFDSSIPVKTSQCCDNSVIAV